MKRVTALFAFAAAVALPASASAQTFNGGLPSGYTCTAANVALGCGTSGASGTATLAPGGGSQFGFVSTNGGSFRNPLNVPSTRDGSSLTSSTFTASAGQSLGFSFNYITSDGSGTFTDYAYVRLIDVTNSTSLVLFTARTTPSGNTVPGFGLPGIAAGVTLTPSSTPIIPGSVTFTPGGLSGCFDTGCGYTGWINAQYIVPTAATYQIEFNVFNVGDSAFDSALLFDFATGQGGTPVNPGTPVPEPMTVSLLVAGLAGLGVAARRRRNA